MARTISLFFSVASIIFLSSFFIGCNQGFEAKSQTNTVTAVPEPESPPADPSSPPTPPAPQLGEDVEINWTTPSYNTDGTPLNDLSGFNIYFGSDSANLDHVTTVNSATATRIVIPRLAPGTWYFSISSLSVSGGEGPRSGVASKTIP